MAAGGGVGGEYWRARSWRTRDTSIGCRVVGGKGGGAGVRLGGGGGCGGCMGTGGGGWAGGQVT